MCLKPHRWHAHIWRCTHAYCMHPNPVKNVVSGFTEYQDKCSWRLRPMSCAPFGSLMVLIVGLICHCIGEVPDAIIKEMFLWMGPWQMNVSLQRQRNRGKSSLFTHTDPGWYTSQRWPPARSPVARLSSYSHRETQQVATHMDMHRFILHAGSV